MDRPTPRQPDSSPAEPRSGQLSDHPLSEGQWIRASADGETSGLIPPEGLPSDADQRIEFDRSLRDMCSRTLGQTTCPQSVRLAVIAAMAQESISAPAMATHDGVVRSGMGDTRSRSFWSGIGRIGAIAAVLALGVTVVYKGVSTGGQQHALPLQQASLLASFFEKHHQSCPTDTRALAEQFPTHSVAEAKQLCAAQLQAEHPTLEISITSMHDAGIHFIGVVPCDVPDQGAAVHLMFQAANDLAPARVSLFIQRDSVNVNIKSSACYLTGCPKSGQLVAWRVEGFVHYLYACTPESLAAARKILHVPQSELPL